MVERIRSKTPPRHYLKEWRQKLGLKQQQVADRMETSKGQISRWESDKRGLSMDVIFALADALGIDAPDLLRDPEQPSIDELLRRASAPPDVRDQAFAVVETLVKRTGTKG